MFRPRNPRPFLTRLREIIWPSRGWVRASRYIGHRLGRLPGSPYRIAAGFACGAAVSFTPLIGLHFLLGAGLALLMRGNLIASAIGTAVGNPWTFPFIWTWIYSLGHWALGDSATTDLPDSITLSYIVDQPLQVLWPMVLGGTMTAPIAWLVFFFPARAVVHQYQRARRRRLRKKLVKRKAQHAAMTAKAGFEPGNRTG